MPPGGVAADGQERDPLSFLDRLRLSIHVGQGQTQVAMALGVRGYRWTYS
jgi:hypothetical protein